MRKSKGTVRVPACDVCGARRSQSRVTHSPVPEVGLWYVGGSADGSANRPRSQRASLHRPFTGLPQQLTGQQYGDGRRCKTEKITRVLRYMSIHTTRGDRQLLIRAEAGCTAAWTPSCNVPSQFQGGEQDALRMRRRCSAINYNALFPESGLKARAARAMLQRKAAKAAGVTTVG